MTAGKVTDLDRGYKALIRSLTAASGVRVEVGVRPDGQQPDLAMIATVHEFGSEHVPERGNEHVPERSFLRSTLDENRVKYGRLLARAADLVFLRGARPENAFGKVGHAVVFDVQRKISSRIDPPNTAATIAAKGSDIPLIDTGRLHESIDYTVVVP